MWTGGGPPSGGIADGDTETFTFSLGGTDLDMLSASDFLSELSARSQGGALNQLWRAFGDSTTVEVTKCPLVPFRNRAK